MQKKHSCVTHTCAAEQCCTCGSQSGSRQLNRAPWLSVSLPKLRQLSSTLSHPGRAPAALKPCTTTSTSVLNVVKFRWC